MDTSGPTPPPPEPWSWNVSQLVVEAYAAGTPAQIILYSSDSDQHTGKYFLTAETGESGAAMRPTLTVVWGDP